MTIEIFTGNIVTCSDDAIVNAANENLIPGGGVCGAIHKAAGSELAEACQKIGHCPTGNAVITPGFKLKARYVIHAVGPIWQGGQHNEKKMLTQCYKNIFIFAHKYHLQSVALPAISTGIYGYPLKLATEVAVISAQNYNVFSLETLIRFVCYNEKVAKIYQKILSIDL